MSIPKTLSLILSTVPVLASLLVTFRLRQPTTPAWWMLKVFSSALSPIMLLIGLLCLALGLIWTMPLLIALGVYSGAVFLVHIFKVTRGPDKATGFEKAFGRGWQNSIPAERKKFFLGRRFVLGWPTVPDPIFTQNIPFHQIPNTDRQLFCDVWEPSDKTTRSGLAFVYLHGSAWTHLDKDFGTRLFFRHLTSQGHVIMDVAHRLFPETNMLGMVHDAKNAIAWIKKNAAKYQVNPDRIVIGGGSSGGHLSMLASYTDNKLLTQSELTEKDLSVRGVINMYGPPDLKALYYHTAQHITSQNDESHKGKPSAMPVWIRKIMGDNYHRLGMDKTVAPGMLAPMLGGHPADKPEAYALFSPINHVHAGCPPTLLILGEHDIITPVSATAGLTARLQDLKVPVVMHLFPQTDHGFDLVLPRISLSAGKAVHDVECFLALMCR